MTSNRMRTIGSRFAQVVKEDDLTGLAAELAYRFLFAIFPFGLFLAALGAFVASWIGFQNPAEQIIAALDDNLPEDLAASLQPELQHVIGSTRPELVSIGAIGALWAATGGTSALIKAMNRAYKVDETRSFIHRLLLGVGLTILGSAGILVSFVTIVGSALVTEEIASQLGLSGAAWGILSLLRWPLVFFILVIAVAVLFRLAPNVKVAWRWVIPGAALFAVGWLIATWGFGFYVSNFGSYGATYGSLAGVIMLMLWFYLTGILLVGSAALMAVVAQVVDPEAIQRRRDEIEERRQAQATGGVKAALGRAFARVRGALPGGTSDVKDGERPTERPERRTGLDRRRAPAAR